MNASMGSGEINPTTRISLSFSNYALERDKSASAHIVDNVTDYCFSLDKQMRRRLALIKPLQAAARSASTFAVAIQRQLMQMQAVAVGPNQLPEIHAIGEDCARRLGIGIPQIFVKFDVVPNAYTLASDECGDMIVLHTSLVEMMTPEELRFVIGHESGHIHNLHTVYNTMVQMLINPMLLGMLRKFPGAGILIVLLQHTIGLVLMAWSRCAEITADRAGLICCGDLDVARHALAKLQTGGIDQLRHLNIEEYIRQIEQVQSTPVRLMEATMSHPITSKRLEAIRLFSRCETFFSWRPERRGKTASLTATQVDDQCESFLSVLSNGYQGFWK